LKILFLGSNRKPQNTIIEFLIKDGNSVIRFHDQFDKNSPKLIDINFIISFGYRYKVESEILDLFKDKAINLHISYLPWNKGADPNLWSILDNTKKGVTIHQMDNKIDNGKILYQKEVFFSENDTLGSSYNKLQETVIELFKSKWPSIKYNRVLPKKQSGEGSYHRSSDKENYKELLVNGWQTKVIDLLGKAIND